MTRLILRLRIEMNNIDYTASNSVGEFALKYFEYLYKVLKSVDPEQINKLGELLLQKRKEKRKFLLLETEGLRQPQ